MRNDHGRASWKRAIIFAPFRSFLLGREALPLDLLRFRSLFAPPTATPAFTRSTTTPKLTRTTTITSKNKSVADTAFYLSSVALCPQPPARLEAVCAALAACGASPLHAADRRGLHPLVVPLASFPAAGTGGGGDPQAERLLSSLLPRGPAALSNSNSNSSSSNNPEVIVGLLRVPSEQRGLQVVSCSRGAPSMELLARSVDELLLRLLAEEEATAMAAAAGAQPGNGGDGDSKEARRRRPLAAAAGPAADGLLSASLLAAAAKAAEAAAAAAAKEAGEEDSSTFSRATLDRALVAAGALSPALCERLLASHLSKGDEMSALITGEWYMRRNHFPGWARPYEHVARIYEKLGRAEEARDCSRVALSLPWWTLGGGFGAAAELAGLPRDGAGARGALEAAERGAGGLPPVTNRDERQRTLDAFAAVLDDGAASVEVVSSSAGSESSSDVDWPSFAERGAGVLEEGGGATMGELQGLAAFVRGAAL